MRPNLCSSLARCAKAQRIVHLKIDGSRRASQNDSVQPLLSCIPLSHWTIKEHDKIFCLRAWRLPRLTILVPLTKLGAPCVESASQSWRREYDCFARIVFVIMEPASKKQRLCDEEDTKELQNALRQCRAKLQEKTLLVSQLESKVTTLESRVAELEAIYEWQGG